MMGGSTGRPRPRSIPLVLTWSLLLALSFSDVFAHHTPKHTRKQLKQRYTKQQTHELFYTKAEADARYLGQGSTEEPAPTLIRTFVVSPTGTPAQNGTSLLQTMAGITASFTSPALVVLEPGVYDLGGQTLVGKDFVDIEGSGLEVTFVRCSCAVLQNSTVGDGAVIHAGASSEIRRLTVQNAGGGHQVHGIDIGPGGTTRVSDVRVEISGATVGGQGVWNHGATLIGRDLEIELVGGAVSQRGIRSTLESNTTLRGIDIEIEASDTSTYGIDLRDDVIARVQDVEIDIIGSAPATNDSHAGVYLLSVDEVHLDGIHVEISGTQVDSTGVYSESSSGVRLRDSDIELHDGDAMAGVDVHGGSASLQGLSVHVLDGTAENRALAFENAPFTVLDSHLVAKGTGTGTDAAAVLAFSSAAGTYNATIGHSRLEATAPVADNARGVLSSRASAGAYQLHIENSEIDADDETVRGVTAFTLFVASNHLDGGAVTENGGTILCAGNWDESYAFNASACF